MIFIDRAPKRCTSSLRTNCIINHEDLRRSRKVQLWISRNGWRPPKYKESISAPFLASRARIFLLAGRLLFSRLSRVSPASLLPVSSPLRSSPSRIDLRLFLRKPYIFRFTVRGAVECPASIQTRVHLRSSRQV